MNEWLRIGGWAAAAVVLLWIAFQVVTAVLSFLSWVLTTIVTLVVAAAVLFAGYLVLSRVLRGGESDATTAKV